MGKRATTNSASGADEPDRQATWNRRLRQKTRLSSNVVVDVDALPEPTQCTAPSSSSSSGAPKSIRDHPKSARSRSGTQAVGAAVASTSEEHAALLRSEAETFRRSVGASMPPPSDEDGAQSVPLVPYLPASTHSRAPVLAHDSADLPSGDRSSMEMAEPEGPNLGEERWFLGLGSKVVGVQHYDGVVSDRESVVLQRQPRNPYDSNAIQVLNMRNEQIGHIPREMAAALAPVLDRMAQGRGQGDMVRVEGHIPRGSGNVFSMPLRLAIFGHDPQGTLAPELRTLGERLQRTYCASARGGVDVVTSQHAEGTPVADVEDATWRQVYGGRPPKQARSSGPSMADIIERELEGIFRTGTRYHDMPEANSPTRLQTRLYPHQAKALYWMQRQELGLTVDEALAEAPADATNAARKGSRKAEVQKQVFFWVKEHSAKEGRFVYRNLATNAAFREVPRLPRGGILADDMGLGKTITALALMLSDPLGGEGDAPKIKRKHKGNNLIVCPLSVLFNWMEQIRFHAPSMRVQLYHGQNRDRDPSGFARHDVTLTTYDIVRSDSKDREKGLSATVWHRVVLDEAHVIKGHRTATAKAVCEALSAERRWCLTGTPIQNSVEDLFVLARFLGLEPFDRFEWFNRTIVRPLKSQDPIGFERLQILLRTWCLRRTKDMRIEDENTGVPRPLLMLPQKTSEVVRVPMDPGDRALYEKLFGLASSRVKQLEEAAELGSSFSQVLQLLTRLRQLCCSCSLLPDSLIAELRASGSNAAQVLAAAVSALGEQKVEDLLRGLEEAQEDDCTVCLQPGCDVVTRCGHPFHMDCIEAAIKQLGRGGVTSCPLCRQPVKKSELLQKLEPLEVTDGTAGSRISGQVPASSKVRSVIDFLLDHVIGKHDRYLRKPHKAIIFSQFTSLLDLIQRELERGSSGRIPFARVDGSMSRDARIQALETFRDHSQVQVILCSLKAAGTGINLTAADHVLLIDPWWNPSVEDQAIDRTHRLGQQRPVRAVRFVAERTVEERILEVHQQKRAVMEGAFSQKSRDELRRMRLQLVASLFDAFPS